MSTTATNTTENTELRLFAGIKFYLFALRMKENIKEQNAHKQLYAALKDLDNDWYQPTDSEDRRIQFVQQGEMLICRSTVEPVGVQSIMIEQTVTVGETLDIRVRLPMMRRHRNEKGTRFIPIKKEDKTEFYTALLNRNGMEVKNLKWYGALDNTVFFIKNKHTVAIPVDDIKATVTITDAKAFASSLLYGIGRCKTYGCGMISVIEGSTHE